MKKGKVQEFSLALYLTASSELVILKGYILANKLIKYVYIYYIFIFDIITDAPIPSNLCPTLPRPLPLALTTVLSVSMDSAYMISGALSCVPHN